MIRFIHTAAIVFTLAAAASGASETAGIAHRYPGDQGIERAAGVVFVENFGDGTLDALRARWSDINNRGGKVLAFDGDAPAGSSVRRSLRMTATRGANEGGHLYRTFEPGYDRLFLRFYVKFAGDAGFNHHFVSLGGEIDPPKHAVGRAGLRPVDRWNSGIEPAARAGFGPPGIWHFYTYWPEMRSWQSDDGKAVNDDGRAFYGNNFEPEAAVPAPRGGWICVEIMVKMNSAPDRYDGEQAMWIDGKPVARFAAGSMTGKWLRDQFRRDPAGSPFEGFRWRTDLRVKVNKLWLSHYVSADQAFPRTDRYADAHPGFSVNRESQTVWFAAIVAATEYIGPLSAPR